MWTGFICYRQLPTNAQTINKGIYQPFIIIKILHMFRLARSHHQVLQWCLSNAALGLLTTLVMLSNLYDSGSTAVVNCCEHGNEYSGYIKVGTFLNI
jgi:hypothetical protein